MKNLDFEWLTDEFMLYCRSTQLREKTMSSYEQTLHLFGRWLADELKVYTVDKATEQVIRKYINDLQERGKYTFLCISGMDWTRKIYFFLLDRLCVHHRRIYWTACLTKNNSSTRYTVEFKEPIIKVADIQPKE